jgi:hypothetical protein
MSALTSCPPTNAETVTDFGRPMPASTADVFEHRLHHRWYPGHDEDSDLEAWRT